MSEEYGNDFVTLIDEDGNEVEFEHIDTVEYNGVTYLAFIPAEISIEEDAEVVDHCRSLRRTAKSCSRRLRMTRSQMQCSTSLWNAPRQRRSNSPAESIK